MSGTNGRAAVFGDMSPKCDNSGLPRLQLMPGLAFAQDAQHAAFHRQRAAQCKYSRVPLGPGVCHSMPSLLGNAHSWSTKRLPAPRAFYGISMNGPAIPRLPMLNGIRGLRKI